MKKLLIPLLLVIVAALVIGCTAGQEEISDEAIDAELEQLSDEELLDLAVGEEDDGASVVGEAYRRYSSYTTSRYKASAKKKVSTRLSTADSVRLEAIGDDLQLTCGSKELVLPDMGGVVTGDGPSQSACPGQGCVCIWRDNKCVECSCPPS